MMRLSDMPSSTKMVDTRSSSMSRPSLCSALAIAEFSTFLMMTAAFFGLKVSSSRASSTPLPRIWSATSRAFLADRPAPLSLAVTSISPTSNVFACCSLRRLGSARLLVRHVAAVGTGQHELAELVAHHVLGHEHGNVLAAVMNGQGQADHFRRNHRTARPGLDRAAIVVLGGDLHLLQQMKVDERTFLERSWHC